MAGFYGDHLVTLATDPQLVKNVVFPNFEAGAKEAGKDPKKMERPVMLTYMYTRMVWLILILHSLRLKMPK